MKRLGSSKSSTTLLLGWYLMWGLLHEAAHLIAAAILGVEIPSEPRLLLRALLGRCCSLPLSEHHDVIRHAGWIVSTFIAVSCFAARRRVSKEICMTAAVTAIEAIFTDLLGVGMVNGVAPTTLFCGNFGVIMLSSAWTTDEGKTALDLLQEMVRVTMMRGAQSGGVVSWANHKQGADCYGIRSRVVNGKRSDLSVRLRRSLEKDVLTRFSKKLKPGIQAFLGHTRFATSSKATFGGTHPHQWTPPRYMRIFEFTKHTTPQSRVRRVETFITHNGDLDFYKVGTVLAGLADIQAWLKHATGAPMPASVDSAAIAGLMDLLRTSGSMALSLRYALLLDVPHSKIEAKPSIQIPSWKDFEYLGSVLDTALAAFCQDKKSSLVDIQANQSLEVQLTAYLVREVRESFYATSSISQYLMDDTSRFESAHLTTLLRLLQSTVKAFFNNDLFEATRLFIKHAKGSFGLMVTCSLDAHRQVCIAASGQPMSVAFYPKKGIVTFGSEQAAVRAALAFTSPGGDLKPPADADEIERESFRLDLDDLGREVCLLDWGETALTVKRNSLCVNYNAIGGRLRITLFQPNGMQDKILLHRLTPLEDTDLIRPQATSDTGDQVWDDLKDIPRICEEIQTSWTGSGLNRLAAWNLSRCLRQRLRDRVSGKIPTHGGTVDFLVTGCEVSLWVGEQFASDLQKAFPKLYIKSMSSNKLLGVFGQELSTPAIGHPVSKDIPDLTDTVVIIVSHSGGNFSPLACSNLLQAFTKNIFVVTSEWDTQIGKQLRNMLNDSSTKHVDGVLASRIFSTDVGIRHAEPCSLTVVATHQLLTNLFQHICVNCSDPFFRSHSGAVITGADIRILERCNRDNIADLERIVGASREGFLFDSRSERDLRGTGRRWSQHVLENVKAYILSFFYIVGTVTSGFPLVAGILVASGLDESSWGFYIGRFFDSLIYFFLPQIFIFLIRLIEGRNLLHRMVARTVVIGDCPWVSQCAEAFLSKIFARSYSIAGLNVLSGNPVDHLVHRHTHRVVRGTLMVFGRPDGRLSALTSAEIATVLAMSQASSIQSLGATCESVTIGHNPSETAMSARDIILDDFRPKFLCEQLLFESEPAGGSVSDGANSSRRSDAGTRRPSLPWFNRKRNGSTFQDYSNHSAISGISLDSSRHLRNWNLSQRDLNSSHHSHRSLNLTSNDIKGRFHGMKGKSRSSFAGSVSSIVSVADIDVRERADVRAIVSHLTEEHHQMASLRVLFDEMDTDKDGRISMGEFSQLYNKVKKHKNSDEIQKLVVELAIKGDGHLGFDAFVKVAQMADVEVERKLVRFGRDERGLKQVDPSEEKYFGESLRQVTHTVTEAYTLSGSQRLAMELYEGRVASMQRFVAMCVMFHEIGAGVEGFFRRYSFGLLGYDMDRTHSILRIATTASPVSGAEIRERMEQLRLTKKVRNAVRVISAAWIQFANLDPSPRKPRPSQRSHDDPVDNTRQANGSQSESIGSQRTSKRSIGSQGTSGSRQSYHMQDEEDVRRPTLPQRRVSESTVGSSLPRHFDRSVEMRPFAVPMGLFAHAPSEEGAEEPRRPRPFSRILSTTSGASEQEPRRTRPFSSIRILSREK